MRNFNWEKIDEVQIEKCSNIIGQYIELKRENIDFIVFFRLGEFYETYFEDAILVSKECEIALTGRELGNKNGTIPMAGVPHGSVNTYIKKLLDKNHRVAICEQGEIQNAKGILERNVVRKYTNGTLFDEEFLNSEENNYIAAIFEDDEKYGFAYCELSTGEFSLTTGNLSQIQAELFKINPSEVLVPEKPREIRPFTIVEKPETEISDDLISPFNYTIIREKCYGNTLIKSKNPEYKLGYKCANAILNYIYDTQKSFAPKISGIKEYRVCDYLVLNETARKNLELTKNIVNSKKFGSLFWAIDNTKTSMGTRLLKSWLNQPLMEVSEILKRQNAIKELFNNEDYAEKLGEILENCYDISRLSSKISNGTILPKDFIALKETFTAIALLRKVCRKFNSRILNFFNDKILLLSDFNEILQKTIMDEPNSNLKEGGLIKDGASAELDSFRLEISKFEKWFVDYEKKLRAQTGIKNLKVARNKVFGYYIEVPISDVKLINYDFKRKQTLSNAERFYTDTLLEKEQKITYLTARANEMEFEIYSKLREWSKESVDYIREFAHKLAQLDVILSLYISAKNNNYVCPRINNRNYFSVVKGRHAGIERIIKNFTPNDIKFGTEKVSANNPKTNSGANFKLLTGPNMAGKSTYMRQNAIIAILTQIGSFVPAESAEVSIIDEIFVRIGSVDNLIKKNSTFMVEMLDVAYILENATDKSLILLDEVGKGTSALDGVAIARAVSEYITEKIGAKTIFATHYHDLKILEKDYPNLIENLMINFVKDDKIDEPKRLVCKGFMDKSYGIDVAKSAQLPEKIIEQAQKYLEKTH